jgi:flagellin
MSTRINTNVSALQAAQNLNTNSMNLATNIERLSSGLQINSAADDPAGWAISQNFKAQISGLNQASSNANDAINEVKTAEGGLTQIQSLLVSMRQLAVQASNLGTNSTVDLQADQTQINSAIASINQIASTTSFGNVSLLNGSASAGQTTTAGAVTATGLALQANGVYNSANAGSYGTISVTTATAATDSVSSLLGGTAGTYINTTDTGLYSGSVVVNGTQYSLGTQTASTLTQLNQAIASSGYQASTNTSGALIFTSQTTGQLASPASINLSSLSVGTNSLLNTTTATGTAHALANSVATLTFGGGAIASLALETVTTAGALTFTINGGSTQSIALTAGETLNTAATAVNALNAGLTLADVDGTHITLTGTGVIGNVALTGTFNNATSAATTLTAINETVGNNAGISYANSSYGSTNNILTSATALFSGIITASGATGVNTFTLGPATSLTSLNTTLASVGVNAAIDVGGDLTFTSVGTFAAPTITLGSGFTAFNSLTPQAGQFTNGNNAVLTFSNSSGSLVSNSTQSIGSTNYFSFSNGLVASSTVSSGAIVGSLVATAGSSSVGQDLQFQIGANGGQTTSIGIQSVAANLLGTGAANYTDANGVSQQVSTDSIQDLNVMTFKGAQDAMAVIDQAINQTSTIQANLGAFQTNVLQSNVNSLGVASQNLSSSLSTVEDTDLSTEIVDYTKNQILVQAGVSALGQANQAPQAILKLLQ